MSLTLSVLPTVTGVLVDVSLPVATGVVAVVAVGLAAGLWVLAPAGRPVGAARFSGAGWLPRGTGSRTDRRHLGELPHRARCSRLADFFGQPRN
jgi:hypothetical protein